MCLRLGDPQCRQFTGRHQQIMFQPEEEGIPFAGQRGLPASQKRLDGLEGGLCRLRVFQVCVIRHHRRAKPGHKVMDVVRNAARGKRGLSGLVVVTSRHQVKNQQVGFDHAGAVQHQLVNLHAACMRPWKEPTRTIVIAEEIVPEDQALPER